MTLITDHFLKDFYGQLAVPKSSMLLVIHYDVSKTVPNDGSGTHSYNHNNPNGYRWHRTFGSHGEMYRCAPWDERGAHDAGLNHRSAGMEHVGNTHTDFSKYPEMLAASAAEAAKWCKWVGTKPSRSRIIGHNEDGKYGGDSTHTDPCGPGKGCQWPWDDYMALVQAAYDGGEEDDDVKIEDLIDLDVYDKDVDESRDPTKSWNNKNNGKPENMRAKMADLIYLLLKKESGA